MMRFINIFFYTIFISLMLGVAGLLVGSMLPIPGNIELKIVKSGSMDPNIPTGSLVVVKPSANYSIGDVITFGADTKTEIPTTHRIVGFEADENGRTAFRTKGDANEDPDTNPIQRSDVIGKVVFHVPYVGFVLDFARQPLGFALLIGVPAALVILEEVMTIVKEVKAGVKRRHRKEEGEDTDEPSQGSGGTRLREVAGPEKLVYLRRRAMDEIFVPMVIQTRGWVREHVPAPKDVYGTATFVVLGIVFVATMLSGGAQDTIAYFNDIERSIDNVFRAGTWGAETLPTGDPQQIVLNEFLPAPDPSVNGLNFGNDNSNMPLGEWIELYNMGTTSVDVNGWYFTDASGGVGNTHAVIDGTNTQPATTIIPPGGWLVVYLNKPTLNNTGDSIFLYTSSSTGSVLVDSYTYALPQPDGCELEPTPTSSNATSTLSGTPGNGQNGECNPNQTPPNKSYARIPDGTGAFVDPIPTPGSPNIPEAEIAPAAPILSGGSSSGEVQGASTETEEPVEEPAEEPAVQPTEEPQTTTEEPPAETAGPEAESPHLYTNDAIIPPETAPTEASSEPPAEDPTEETPAPGDVAPAEPAPESAPDTPTE